MSHGKPPEKTPRTPRKKKNDTPFWGGPLLITIYILLAAVLVALGVVLAVGH